MGTELFQRKIENVNTGSNVDFIHGNLENGLSVNFGKEGNINSFNVSGFDLNDGDFYSWTEKQTAWIDIAARWPAKDLSIKLSAMPYLAVDQIIQQQIFIHVNGLFCGFHGFFEQDDCSFLIPRNAISGRSTRISITIPTAISPKRLGLSEDIRELGIAITTLSLLSV
ncbi:hypothetical protein AiwAL_04045 [Acidiphilium sp. AL]|uniref:hypothetical protein n=1 Tax=Acidiphilium TaxID=522 RepID=UPI001F362DF0|nr:MULTISPECIES: hypothetical protein [Acidiphilium]MCU4159276.1 hypothetical protein [Acidiphilium sp. AL]